MIERASIAELKVGSDGDYVEEIIKGAASRTTRIGLDPFGRMVVSSVPISASNAIADGNTPFEISVSSWSTLKFLKFQTKDNRPEIIDRISPIFTFTKDDFTRDHAGWVYTEISTNEYQHTIESPNEYFFTMRTVVDPLLDTAIITLSEVHAGEPNRYGGVTGAVVGYDTQQAQQRYKGRAIDVDFIKNISIADITDGDAWVSWDDTANQDIFYSYRATGPVADMVPEDFRANDAAVTGTVGYWHKHSGSSVSSVTTARYQPDTFYAADSPILEPNPADNNEPYTWTADEDFTSSNDPDFDGTGFTAQEKAPVAIGTEIDITGGNTTPKTFAGNSVAKAADITARNEAVVRKFVPSAPVEQWGVNVAGGQIRTVISTVNGEQYQVRDGKTVTLQADPSENLVEWVRTSDIAPPEWNFALADLQALTFEALVGKTGQIAYLVDTEETLQYSQSSTAASVAPRKAYESANPAVGQEGIGVWIVISPSEVAAQFEVFGGTETTPKLHSPKLLHEDIEFITAPRHLLRYSNATKNLFGTNAAYQKYAFVDGKIFEARVPVVDPNADPSGTSVGLKALREANWRQVSGVLLLKTNTQSIPNSNFNNFVSADELPPLERGDTIQITIKRAPDNYSFSFNYIQENDIHQDHEGANTWRVSISSSGINIKVEAGNGTQTVEVIKIWR